MIKQSYRLFRLAFRENKLCKQYLIKSVVLELISIGLLYYLNSIYGHLYQSIQDYNIHGIWLNISFFCGIAGVLVVTEGYTNFILNRLSFEIRNGLTTTSFKHIDIIDNIPNIEQRIQEDLKRFGDHSVEFWFSVFKAVVKLPLFLGVIISLTHWYTGAIIVLAVIIGTIITRYVANSLVQLQSEQETNEANFRKAMENNMIRGEMFFIFIKLQFYAINKRLKYLSFTQSGFGQGFTLLPFIVLMPLYIMKSVTMGQFFQSVNALAKVVDSLTILIDNRQIIVAIGTCLTRLESLTNELDK